MLIVQSIYGKFPVRKNGKTGTWNSVWWRGLALFAIFEKLHVSADQIFLGGQFQNISKNLGMRKRHISGKVFIFKKLQGP